jgi:hypothetical protein
MQGAKDPAAMTPVFWPLCIFRVFNCSARAPCLPRMLEEAADQWGPCQRDCFCTNPGGSGDARMPLRNPSTFQAGKGTDPEAGQAQCLPATLALRVPRPWGLPTLSMNNKSFLVYTVFLEEKDSVEQILYLYFVPPAQQLSVLRSEIKMTCLT